MNSCVVIISIVYFSISWLVIAWPDLPTRQSLLKVAAVSLPNTGLDCQRNVRKMSTDTICSYRVLHILLHVNIVMFVSCICVFLVTAIRAGFKPI